MDSSTKTFYRYVNVHQLPTSGGGYAANQYVIRIDDDVLLQSYRVIVAALSKGKVYLDTNYWDYSRTTMKYLKDFLMDDSIAEVRKKIESGEYILRNLN